MEITCVKTLNAVRVGVTEDCWFTNESFDITLSKDPRFLYLREKNFFKDRESKVVPVAVPLSNVSFMNIKEYPEQREVEKPKQQVTKAK